MNSGNSKISDSHRLILILRDKKTLKEVINMLLYQILAYTMLGKL